MGDRARQAPEPPRAPHVGDNSFTFGTSCTNSNFGTGNIGSGSFTTGAAAPQPATQAQAEEQPLTGHRPPDQGRIQNTKSASAWSYHSSAGASQWPPSGYQGEKTNHEPGFNRRIRTPSPGHASTISGAESNQGGSTIMDMEWEKVPQMATEHREWQQRMERQGHAPGDRDGTSGTWKR